MGGVDRRRTDGAFEDAVKMRQKGVASGVNVYGGIKGLDIDNLINVPLDPVTLTR